MHPRTIIIGIYNPPELYPPTLWAIRELERSADKIIVVTRNITVEHWPFSQKVKVIRLGKSTTLNAPKNIIQKAFDFILFFFACLNIRLKEKPIVWLAYDTIPLLAFNIFKILGLIGSSVFWYHSHDVAEIKKSRKFSVSWFAAYFEPSAFRRLNIFSLPSAERMKYFPLNKFKGEVILLPNYPSVKFAESFNINYSKPSERISLIYQGSISPGHCLEEVIQGLASPIDNLPVYLDMVGWCQEAYKNQLLTIAEEAGVSHLIQFIPPVPYHKLFPLTAAHHIGLAIHKPENIIYTTGGTASNKIYEYAAAGLPVLLYDNEHFRSYLGKFNWCFFTDGTISSIRENIKLIMLNHRQYSENSRHDVREELSFEQSFHETLTAIRNKSVNDLLQNSKENKRSAKVSPV